MSASHSSAFHKEISIKIVCHTHITSREGREKKIMQAKSRGRKFSQHVHVSKEILSLFRTFYSTEMSMVVRQKKIYGYIPEYMFVISFLFMFFTFLLVYCRHHKIFQFSPKKNFFLIFKIRKLNSSLFQSSIWLSSFNSNFRTKDK